MTTCQAQSGWLQHDFGHLSVFNSTTLNHAVHDLTIGLMKVRYMFVIVCIVACVHMCACIIIHTYKVMQMQGIRN